jgi:hypothetical protein
VTLSSRDTLGEYSTMRRSVKIITALTRARFCGRWWECVSEIIHSRQRASGRMKVSTKDTENHEGFFLVFLCVLCGSKYFRGRCNAGTRSDCRQGSQEF